jgi:hypothetical protein
MGLGGGPLGAIIGRYPSAATAEDEHAASTPTSTIRPEGTTSSKSGSNRCEFGAVACGLLLIVFGFVGFDLVLQVPR